MNMYTLSDTQKHLAAITLASSTEGYEVHPSATAHVRLVVGRDVATHEEQQTPSQTTARAPLKESTAARYVLMWIQLGLKPQRRET